MTPSKVDAAVEDCLALLPTTDRKLSGTVAYLKMLKASSEWSQGELIEVQMLVIRELMKRLQDKGT